MTSAGFLEPVLAGEEDRSLVHGAPLALHVSPAQVLLCGLGPGLGRRDPHTTGEGPASSSVWGGGCCSVSRPHLGVHLPGTASPAWLWCERIVALKEWPQETQHWPEHLLGPCCMPGSIPRAFVGRSRQLWELGVLPVLQAGEAS